MGENNFIISDFDSWFETMDTGSVGTLEQSLIYDYISKQANRKPLAKSSSQKMVSKDQI